MVTLGGLGNNEKTIISIIKIIIIIVEFEHVNGIIIIITLPLPCLPVSFEHNAHAQR